MGSDGQVGWKQITVVFCVLLVILFVGAGIFKALEENFYNPEAPPERLHDVEDIVAEFVQNYSYATQHEVYELLKRIDISRHGYSLNDNELLENKSHSYHLDYMESWYFCMTIVTTIGYGHMGPLTDAGMIFCCIYALIGIPAWIVLLTLVGAQLNDSSRWIEKRVRELLARVTQIPRKFRAPGLAISLTIMMASFFFLPALVFHKVETWTYLEAIYFCVITLTTVGFGDFVPAKPTEDMNTAANIVYKISVFLWITVGLAFLAGSLERIGTALKILGEKVTDMDLDPLESTDESEGGFIGETEETDHAESDPLNRAGHKNGSDNVRNGRKSREEKELKLKELSDWGKNGSNNELKETIL
ncbi:potassium channel subfamily K member 10-like [Branchiostoma lanceolatum]|uniref:potassium channel subfamily K member 10-like n=1 Tax=Branchiostoma lanceolatum TaxID=7740 RepID=UPI003452B217